MNLARGGNQGQHLFHGPMPDAPTSPTPPADAFEPQARPDWLWKAAACAALAVIVVLFGLLPYQHWEFGHRMSVLAGWFKWVNKYADWQFCLVVPVISGVLVWARRAELRAIPWQGTWAGAPVLATGMFFYWLGYKADTGYPAFLAIQLALAGMVLLIAGTGWMRALFFMWLFMFFTWPMQPLEDSVASPLRPRTASITARLLNVLGTPAQSEGSALYSAADPARGIERGTAFSLDVDAKCSGINSLFALMMISALLGYLALRSPRSRLILFVCAIPLAVAGNIARMLLLAFGSMWFGSEFAVGKRIGEHQEMSAYHTFAGFAVFGVALAGMFALCWVLEGREMRANLKRHQQALTAAARGLLIPLPRRTLAQIIAVVMIAGVTAGICAATDTRYLVARAGVTLELPLQVGDYQGRMMEVTALEKKLLDEGVKLSRAGYLDTRGRQVLLSLVLSGHLKRSLHRPEVCLPGQGWTIVESTPVRVPLPGGRFLEATTLRLFADYIDGEDGRRKRRRGVNLYWYIGSDDTTCATHYEHVATTYLDAIFRNINHRWAMASVFIQVPDLDPANPDAMFAEFNAIEDAREFAAKVMPLITDPGKIAAE
jgi:exosortase